jgi:hypothetical protein
MLRKDDQQPSKAPLQSIINEIEEGGDQETAGRDPL